MKEPSKSGMVRDGECAHPGTCPLSRVEAGTVVCIKQLFAPAEVSDRLRELGFCEEQNIQLLSRNGNVICRVCDARLGISSELADTIIVQPLTGGVKAA